MAEKIVNYNDIKKVNDMVTLNLMKENFDRDFQKQKDMVETIELANAMSAKSFGYIKESFENMSPALFKSKEGREIMNKYISTIKESAELRKMHLLYECIRKASKDIDISSYINEAISMIGVVDSGKYVYDTAKLGLVLAEACIKLGKEKTESLTVESSDLLNEAIDFVGTHKKTPKNLAEYTKYCATISNNINSRESSPVNESSIKQNDIEKSINEFNEKYGKELDESGQSLVKELLESTNKEDIFKKYKDICINKINDKKTLFESSGDTMSSDRLEVILEKVSRKNYNPETVNMDVFNLIEMTNSLE